MDGFESPYVERLPHRTGARVRLFCLPHAGGSARAYRTFHQHLPRDVEVCAIQPPGRDQRIAEPALGDLSTLVREIVAAIVPLLDRPFALFGHSMGALAAYETARALRDRGSPAPASLFVSGCRAPHLPHDGRPLHDLDDAAFLERLRRYDGTPEFVLRDPELAQLFLPTIRADLCAMETYRFQPGPAVACPVVACGGVQDPDVSREQLARWCDLTSGRFEIAMFPGGHFYLREREARVVQLVAESLEDLAH
ncbi:MAG TPA: alpha/beta fold hydrolase [Polyangiaceae bacterium]|nr:alpha/beta fold hydrolase [Polyangiaceae bacterium]